MNLGLAHRVTCSSWCLKKVLQFEINLTTFSPGKASGPVRVSKLGEVVLALQVLHQRFVFHALTLDAWPEVVNNCRKGVMPQVGLRLDRNCLADGN